MPVITLSSGKQFMAKGDESLLAAALRHELLLPYSCRNGRCSTCKGRVSQGSTRALDHEFGLTAAERDIGWILTCVRTATSDVTLDIEDLTGLNLVAPRMFPCRIQSLNLLAADVMRIVFRLPPTSPFNYLPGQYIDVSNPDGHRRSYSIANAMHASKLIELHVKRVPGGTMSNYWFDRARVNDLMRFNGPLGTFFVRDLTGLDLIFLATGTGMAPVKAMLEGLSGLPEAMAPRSVAVFWGARAEPDFYLDPADSVFAGRLIPVVSRGDAAWAGARGYVQDACLASGPTLSRTVVYACGSDAMIRDARALLMAAGLPERRFHSDAFVCSGDI